MPASNGMKKSYNPVSLSPSSLLMPSVDTSWKRVTWFLLKYEFWKMNKFQTVRSFGDLGLQIWNAGNEFGDIFFHEPFRFGKQQEKL